MQCYVCGSDASDLIYVAENELSLTSMCTVATARVRVWSCETCSHLFNQPLLDTAAYYESGYNILLDHVDEDQIYSVTAGVITYRTDHQLQVMTDLLPLKSGERLLDYGCAKAAVVRRLLSKRRDIKVHLFDVSSAYKSHWMNLVPEDQTAIYQTPASWNESFDLVTSFFVLEHVHELRKTLEHIYALVADGGYFYGVVPDTFGNVADFIVVDHVNHFTQPSLHIALAQVGFGDITIDATLHRGALTFHARKSGGAVDKPLHSHFIAESRKIAEYWKNLRMNLRAREKNTKGLAAIYGSGFYGAYILTNLQDASRVEYFVDSSRFQQGKNVLNKPVFAPNALMANTQVMYVGLNPVIARQVMETMTSIFDANIECVFLDETQS